MANNDDLRDLIDQMRDNEKKLKRLKGLRKIAGLAFCSLIVGIVLIIIRFLWVDSDVLLVLGAVLAVAGFIYLEFID